MSKNYSASAVAKLTLLAVLVTAFLSTAITYVVVRPSSSEIDPRCDPLFIKNVGSEQCNAAGEQREYLRYLKNPNGS